ncbi:glycoside hydrolase [Pluteus cervinus]|uniref:Glycoside hydrolase n=1 Tax=Pluteus cervinus TaxID=181527 RepID=A0ACD3AER6_9AGAR|nr:glycoside hydrolase [Pluteus cervinus]
MRSYSILAVAAFYATSTRALNNGAARLPVLGYNTWNFYQCNIDEDLMITTANLMKDLGLQDAGYNYVNIDDCYSEKDRDANGFIVEDKVRFKRGMKWLNDEIHALGFKTGIYSDAGWQTCAGYPGSYQNEVRDGLTFTEWGFDYLKYDNCAIPYDRITREGVIGRFRRMAEALVEVEKQTGKALVFSLCEWGWNQVWLWGADFGHSWRTTGDIDPNWKSIAKIIDFNSFITAATDFHGRNDLDMLQLGNGHMSFEESKSHFTAWALMRSPLLIGTNLSAITPETLSILKNEEILAINQDPVVGKSISPFRWGINPDWTSNKTHPAQYWSGPSSHGVVFMLLNTLDEPATLSFNLTESPWIRAGRQYAIRDLWAHTDNGTAIRQITLDNVPPHGVVALLLKDDGDEPEGTYPECAKWWQCTDRNGTIIGGHLVDPQLKPVDLRLVDQANVVF